MGDEFRIEISDTPDRHHVRLIGELDMATAHLVSKTLVAVAGSTVVADLSDLIFIDSAGVSALMVARQRIEAQGDAMEIRGAKGNVRRVFKVLGLEDLLSD